MLDPGDTSASLRALQTHLLTQKAEEQREQHPPTCRRKVKQRSGHNEPQRWV